VDALRSTRSKRNWWLWWWWFISLCIGNSSSIFFWDSCLHRFSEPLFNIIFPTTISFPKYSLPTTFWNQISDFPCPLSQMQLAAYTIRGHAAGISVGWDTALQARRSRVQFPIVS
jgi:hypothetical protein